MIFDVLGNMYVADDRNHRTQSFPFGELKGITAADEIDVFGQDNEHLYYPSSMVVDNQLNLYVADQYNHRRQLLERY
jgi:sugar lactone lactonase YvrE